MQTRVHWHRHGAAAICVTTTAKPKLELKDKRNVTRDCMIRRRNPYNMQ
jgi:hypothetical protein